MSFDDGYEEDDDFRTIFPEELWELILDEMMIISAEAVERLRRSPFFRRLLIPTRARCLFPQVLNILHENGYVIPKKTSQQEEHEYFAIVEERARPPYYHHNEGDVPVDQSSRDILKLRQVCHVWKSAVDDFYRKKLFHQKSKDIAYGRTFEQTFRPVSNFTLFPRTSIQQFITHFKDSSGIPRRNLGYSPFQVKGCTFIFTELRNSNLRQYQNDISTLMRTYGRHLEKCSFDFTQVTDCRAYLHKFLEWLKYLPNVKKLEIFGWEYPPVLESARRSMERALLKTPIRRMKRLEHVVLDRVDFPVGAGILTANNHVGRLNLTYCLNSEGRVIINELPKLSHLKLNIYTDEQFDIFESSKFNSPLRTLELRLHFVEYPPLRVFTLLEKMCGETLESLYLIISRKAFTTKLDWKSQLVRHCERLQRMYLPNLTAFQVVVKESHSDMLTTMKCHALMSEYLHSGNNTFNSKVCGRLRKRSCILFIYYFAVFIIISLIILFKIIPS